MKQGKLSFSKLLGVAALLQCSALFAADNADDYDFTTVVAAPENAEVLNVKSVFNSLTDLVFFSSKKEDHTAGGFYKLDLDSRSWPEFKLPITRDYLDTDNHGIIDATDGPYKNTLVLSYKTNDEGTVQYLSNTGNGGLWHSQKINVLENFTNIAKTKVYGQDDNAEGSLATELVLENKLLFTPDFTYWYTVEIPFASDEVKAVFKSHRDGLLASVTDKADGSHKLWFTKDYKNWNAYDMPANAKVLVAQTGYEDYITLSLSHDGVSDIVVFDPETQAHNVFATFEGDVTDMSWHNNSLNLSGNFINFRDEAKALLVNMKKKVTDDSTDGSDDDSSEDDAEDSEEATEESTEETLIDINYLRPFKG